MNSNLLRTVIVWFLALCLAGCGSQAVPQTPTGIATQDSIVFYADQNRIQRGECTFLRWEVMEGFGATLDGEEVPMGSEVEVCPEETSSYELAVDMGTYRATRVVEIIVSAVEGEPSAERAEITPGQPAYLAGSWVATGGPPGGLGYDIRMRPDNPDIMFVTDAHAGVHKSTDGGMTWFPSNAGITTMIGSDVPIFCLTIDPHDYDVIWAGTQLLGHVYRSSDNGETWVEMDDGISEDGRSIRGITIDPNDPDIIYAADEIIDIAWAREKGLAEPHGVGGEVYRSTNGGRSWSLIWSGDNLARYVWVDPRDSDRIYVSTGIFDREAANSTPENRAGVGILRSDDGGRTWTVLNEANGLGGLIIPSLFMHPHDPDTLIAAVSNMGVGGVFVTHDGGDTWARAEGGPISSDAVEIAMSDPDIWYSASEGVIWRSDDAGKTWQSFALRTADRAAGMPIDLQVDPRNPYRIFDNNYGGGNFLSNDGGETWVDASVGYSGATIAGMLVLPGDGRTVLAGANTAGFRSLDAGATWAGTDLPTATQILQMSDGLIASDSGGSVWHSQDGGETWSKTRVIDLLQEMTAGRMTNDVASMRALAAAPSDPNVLYLGFNNATCITGTAESCLDPMPNMYRSNDGGHTWHELADSPFARKGVLSIAVHPQDSKRLWAATVMGLFYSTNGGEDWEKVESFDVATHTVPIRDTDNPMVKYDLWVVTDVVFDAFDPAVLYATTQHGAIWRSSDTGESWVQAAAGMDPNELITMLLADPLHPQIIYAASSLSGVFVTQDGGQSWHTLNDGLAARNIANLALSEDSSILYAGSTGSGVFRLATPATAQ